MSLTPAPRSSSSSWLCDARSRQSASLSCGGPVETYGTGQVARVVGTGVDVDLDEADVRVVKVVSCPVDGDKRLGATVGERHLETPWVHAERRSGSAADGVVRLVPLSEERHDQLRRNGPRPPRDRGNSSGWKRSARACAAHDTPNPLRPGYSRPPMRRAGTLHVITGCMFSGKTEELLRQLRARPSAAGQSFSFGRPRTRAPRQRSPNPDQEPASPARPFRGRRLHGGGAASPCEVVAIDEAEMFDEEPAAVVDRLAVEGYEVIVSGLDTDFAGRPFGAMPTLLALADSVAKLTAICTFPGCGQEATRTQRLVNNQPAAIDDPLIVIGGTEDRREPDRYEARCRTHHRVARGAATRASRQPDQSSLRSAGSGRASASTSPRSRRLPSPRTSAGATRRSATLSFGRRHTPGISPSTSRAPGHTRGVHSSGRRLASGTSSSRSRPHSRCTCRRWGAVVAGRGLMSCRASAARQRRNNPAIWLGLMASISSPAECLERG